MHGIRPAWSVRDRAKRRAHYDRHECLYAGSASDNAAWGTHTGGDLSTGWTIHVVPDGLVDDFIGDLNAHGVTVGTGVDPVIKIHKAYLFDPTTGRVTVPLGLGGARKLARRINDAGVIVGASREIKGSPPSGPLGTPVLEDRRSSDHGRAEERGARRDEGQRFH